MMGIRSEAQDGDNLRLALEVAKASLDPSTKVGGIFLHADGRRTPCYNNFLTMEDEQVAGASRDARYADVLHPEEVGLLELGMDRAKGTWYFGTHEPCGRCWKLLAWMGVDRVVYLKTVEVRRMGDVDLAFAVDEGEGFETVEEWRDAHVRFFTSPEMTAALGEPPVAIDDDTLVVCIRFRLVERL